MNNYTKDLLWITKRIALTWWLPLLILTALLSLSLYLTGLARADTIYTDEAIANAIYRAEGGAKTAHAYGILKHYKHTTPRNACLNTIRHAKKDWNGKGDFIVFLGNRYCPVNCDNDRGTNKFWIKNVKFFLEREVI